MGSLVITELLRESSSTTFKYPSNFISLLQTKSNCFAASVLISSRQCKATDCESLSFGLIPNLFKR